RGGVDAVLHGRFKRAAPEYRLPGQPHVPGNQLALRIQADARAVDVQRPIIAAAHVVFASPYQLDRGVNSLFTRRLGDVGGFGNVVGVRTGAPSEAAARVQLRDEDFFRRQAQHFGHDALIHGLELFAVPDVAAVVTQVHQAVHG